MDATQVNFKTPTLKVKLHRMIEENSHIEMSPLRRTSKHENVSAALNYTPEDDELDRRKRRSSIQIRRTLDHIQEKNNSRLDRNFNEKQSKEHYQLCQQLYSGNKITKMNVWKLYIIDVTQDLCQTANSFDALQIGANCLEICAKVYGLRVDSVYEDGNRLLNRIQFTSERTQVDEESHDNGADEVAETEKPPKSKRKRFNEINKVTTNDLSTLLGTVNKIESNTFSLKTDIHSNPIGNLFTNVLKTDYNCLNIKYKHEFMDSQVLWFHEPQTLKNEDEIVDCPNLPQINDHKICHKLNNFYIDEWNPENESKMIAEDTFNGAHNEVVYNADGFPIPELDEELDVPFEDIHNDSDVENRPPEYNANDLIPVESVEDVCYQAFRPLQMSNGRFIEKLWAGPCHWKAKHIKHPQQDCADNKNVQQTKKRKRKEIEPLDFVANIDLDVLNSKCKQRQKDAQYSTTHLLPIPDWSLKYLGDTLRNFMLKQTTALVPKKSDETNNNDDYEVADYNFENPNDSFYCSQSSKAQTEEIVVECASDNNNENLANFDEKLIDEPDMVNKEIIPYVLCAKKINMHKLKEHVKQQLDNRNELTFVEMYKNLEKTLPTKMKNELSVHLGFASLLHVCNEQNLILKPTVSNHKDFLITKSV